MLVSRSNIKADDRLKFSKAYRAEIALHSNLFVVAIEPIHRALIVCAVSHAKHVASLMYHYMTGILEHSKLRVHHSLIVHAFWVKAQEAENTSPLFIHGPAKDKQPVLVGIEILLHDGQHAVGILRDHWKRLFDYSRCIV